MEWRKSRISAISRPPSSIFRATASAGRPECRVEADARGRRFRAEGQHHEILGGIAGRGHRGTGAEAEAPVVAGVAEQHAADRTEAAQPVQPRNDERAAASGALQFRPDRNPAEAPTSGLTAL